MNLHNYTTSLNLILFDLNTDLNQIMLNFSNYVALNLGNDLSIKVEEVIKDRKSKVIYSSLSTSSEFPHDLLTSTIELLKNRENIFVGTYGLSYQSIAEICLELKKKYQDQKKIIFICHQRKIKKGDYEVYEGELLNENDIISLFLNS